MPVSSCPDKTKREITMDKANQNKETVPDQPVEIVNTAEALENLIVRVKRAQKEFATFSQEQVNAIFKAAAAAADKARIPLAKMAVEDTGMGIVEDKIIKNHFASEYIYNKYKNEKTCGVIKADRTNGIKIVAEPLGVIAGVVPTTNPTSTAVFKSLICLKTRSAIIFSPHPRAKKSTIAAARLIRDAAVAAGAPKDIIAWIDEPTLELSHLLMTHPLIDSILATGGPGMVKAAYSSGKPALGVGAGNTPAVIDETADVEMAVSYILMSKTFDNGMICASEQSVIAVKEVYDQVKKELEFRGAYILNQQEAEQLSKIILTEKMTVNADIVGQSAATIAKLAGFEVPPHAKVLVSEQTSTDRTNPFAHEKLSPILALYKADNFEQATDMALELVNLGGVGHTSVLYTDSRSQERINFFATKLPTGRLLINSPSSQGGIGDLL